MEQYGIHLSQVASCFDFKILISERQDIVLSYLVYHVDLAQVRHTARNTSPIVPPEAR